MTPQAAIKGLPHLLGAAHAHFVAGRFSEAAAACEQVLAADPTNAYSLHMLGLLAGRRGDLARAAEFLAKAAESESRGANHRADLARILGRMGRWEEALRRLREAVELGDTSSATCCDLGVALQMMGRFTEAAEMYAHAAALDPASQAAQRNLANVLLELGRAEEAVAAMRAVVSLAPADAAAHSDLLLAMHYCADVELGAIQEETARWADRHAHPLYPIAAAAPIAPAANRKLRIGYVSPDFRLHPVGLLLKAILPAHDREHFELFCYSAVRRPDELMPLFAQFCDGWRDISRLDDERAAAVLREDEIDVLIDMAGHTAHNRLTLFARRPAPVQMTWFGYPDSSGLRTMDWRITDGRADPSDVAGMSAVTEADTKERLLRLPNVAWCYPPPLDAPLSGPLPAQSMGYVTFACLNRLAKITPATLRTFSQIMAATPNSRLMLLRGAAAGDAGLRERLKQCFGAAGVDIARVEVVGRLRQHEYFELYQRIDLALDCFPYNGAVSSCDALWMGVPVVALSGSSYVSRQGVSILSSLGLSDWLADSPEHYVQLAIEGAHDLPRLASLRSTLRQRMLRSPLCDVPAFTRDLENAYRHATETIE